MSSCRMITAVLAIALALVCLSCGPRYSRDKTEEKTSAKSTPVRVVVPQPSTDVNLAAPRSGVVRATGQVQVAFQVSGQVETIHVDQGDYVTKGQALATLDERMFAAQEQQATGAMTQAVAALALAEEGTRAEEIAAIRAQVAALEAKVEQTNADYERAVLLFEQGVISHQSMDAALSGLEQVTQNLIAANEQLGLAVAGPRPQELDQARAAVLVASGALGQAVTQLEYATLRAPIDGTIVFRGIEPGQSVGAGVPVFEVADLVNLEVLTEIPEGELARVKPGHTAELTFPAAAGLTASGTVMSVSPNAQATTRGFPVKIRIESTDGSVIPGMVALVSLDYQQPPGGLVIPSRAIIDGAVYVEESGLARLRKIEVLLDIGERAFVTGLDESDRVLVNGQHFVKDGDRIEIVDALGVEELVKLNLD